MRDFYIWVLAETGLDYRQYTSRVVPKLTLPQSSGSTFPFHTNTRCIFSKFVLIRLNPGYKEPLAPTVLPYISGSLYSRFTRMFHDFG